MIFSTNFDGIWENQFFDFVYLLLDRITYIKILMKQDENLKNYRENITKT